MYFDLWEGGFREISIWREGGSIFDGISILGGGRVRYNFDWEGWGANEHTFLATRINRFVINNWFMALLRHILWASIFYLYDLLYLTCMDVCRCLLSAGYSNIYLQDFMGICRHFGLLNPFYTLKSTNHAKMVFFNVDNWCTRSFLHYLYMRRLWKYEKIIPHTNFQIHQLIFIFFDDLHLQINWSISPKASVENSSAQWAII